MENIILFAYLLSYLLFSVSILPEFLSVPSINTHINIFSLFVISHNAGFLGLVSAYRFNFSFNGSMPLIFGYPLIISKHFSCWLRLFRLMKSFNA